MLKLTGAVMVILGCGVAGLIVARHYIQRPQYLKSILSALQMLETQIIYAASPLPEALRMIGQRCDKKISSLFTETGQLLIQEKGYSSTEAWNKALEKNYQHTALSAEDLSILKNFGETLGISDRKDQQKHLKLASEQIKLEITKAEAAAAKSTRMWRYMGFLGGLVIVLIIY